MDNEEKHYPGQEEPQEPQPDTPEPEAPKEETPEEPKPEEPSEPAKEEEPKEPEPQLPKKRSIYDDLKDKKKEAKEAKSEAETARAEAEEAKARAAELEQLLSQRDQATTPKEKADVDDEIAALAAEAGADPTILEKLLKIATKRFQLPDDIKADLEAIRKIRTKAARDAEDADILSHAPTVKETLSVHDDKELQTVMQEVLKLAHTNEFHDKEVEYIVWKNRDALSKLVSPKRPSFESGDSRPDSEGGEEIDFSSGRVTPEQAARAMHSKSAGYEIRRGR